MQLWRCRQIANILSTDSPNGDAGSLGRRSGARCTLEVKRVALVADDEDAVVGEDDLETAVVLRELALADVH